MASNRFYKVGGALVPGEPSFKSYVKRPADEELFGKARSFCYVLSTRQMGKTSLMARTLRRLRRKGTLTSVVDLTRLGTAVGDLRPTSGVTGSPWRSSAGSASREFRSKPSATGGGPSGRDCRRLRRW